MNILFMTSWYPSSDHPGEYTFVRLHARAAQAAGHEVRVLVVPDPNEHPQARQPATQITDGSDAGVPTWWSHAAPSRLPGSSYPAAALLAGRSGRMLARTQRPDVVHSHSLDASVPAQALARRLGVPHVHTVHWSHVATGELTRWQRLKIRLGVVPADGLLPVSHFLAAAATLQSCRGWTQVVPNALDASRFANVAPGPDASHVSATWIGAWRDIKDPELALAAADLAVAEDPGFRLRMVGADRPPAVPDRPHVEWIGRVPHEAVLGLLRRTSMLWVTSRLETFGVAALEAIAAGVPVVATPHGAIPEVVTEDAGRFASTAVEFAAASSDILAGRWRPSPNAAEHVREDYSLKTIGAQLTGAYQRAASDSRPTGRTDE